MSNLKTRRVMAQDAMDTMQPGESIHLRIRRQVCPNRAAYWEEFVVSYQLNMNVVSALMDIEANPVNTAGEPTTPVAYYAACLE